MSRALALPFCLALSAHLLPAESLPRLNFNSQLIPTEHLTISPDRIAVSIPVTTANGNTLYSGQPTEGLSIDTGFRLPFAATGIHHVLMIAAPTRPSRGLAFTCP